MQGMSPNGPATPISWVPAADGYSLALDGTTLICRNPKGTVLKSVPSAVRKGDDAEALLALRDWLVRHDKACRCHGASWPGPGPIRRGSRHYGTSWCAAHRRIAGTRWLES
jgi:hypothetical protein